MRRPHRLVIAVGLLVGGAGIALLLRGEPNTNAPRASTGETKATKSFAPLPLELADESPQPAHLSGKVEPEVEVEDAQLLNDHATTEEADATPFDIMPWPESWQPSMRPASYASRDAAQPPRPQDPSKPAPKTGPKPEARIVLHRIVDGDTLPALAKRYLGSSNRQGEILAANRDRLQSPDLLPIGLELKIPVPQE